MKTSAFADKKSRQAAEGLLIDKSRTDERTPSPSRISLFPFEHGSGLFQRAYSPPGRLQAGRPAEPWLHPPTVKNRPRHQVPEKTRPPSLVFADKNPKSPKTFPLIFLFHRLNWPVTSSTTMACPSNNQGQTPEVSGLDPNQVDLPGFQTGVGIKPSLNRMSVTVPATEMPLVMEPG